MAQELLDGADVIAGLEQMGGERMAKRGQVACKPVFCAAAEAPWRYRFAFFSVVAFFGFFFGRELS